MSTSDPDMVARTHTLRLTLTQKLDNIQLWLCFFSESLHSIFRGHLRRGSFSRGQKARIFFNSCVAPLFVLANLGAELAPHKPPTKGQTPQHNYWTFPSFFYCAALANEIYFLNFSLAAFSEWYSYF